MTKPRSHKTVNILNLSFGVQSFTLAAMSALGYLPLVDLAVFSDTGHERQSTYELMRRFTPWLAERGIPLRIGRAKSTNPIYTNGHGSPMPVHMAYTKKMISQRHCTNMWKIRPARLTIRDYMRENKIPMLAEVIHQWFGISLDEYHRMHTSNIKYVKHRYPLVELRMTRDDCINWLTEHDLPIPTKSSCVCCPYAGIKTLKTLDQTDRAEAIRIDNLIRHSRKGVESFINRSLKPIEQVFERFPINNQDDEEMCETGYCMT